MTWPFGQLLILYFVKFFSLSQKNDEEMNDYIFKAGVTQAFFGGGMNIVDTFCIIILLGFLTEHFSIL